MTELKCPFCGQELDKDICGEMGCPNDKCKDSMFLIGTEELWQELIRTRKTLEIAVDALKYANKCIKGGCVNWETEIDKALEQITALEQKDK